MPESHRLHQLCPIFSVQDLRQGLRHYQSLGFVVRAYADGYGYGFAHRDGVAVHLSQHAGSDHGHPGSAYL